MESNYLEIVKRRYIDKPYSFWRELIGKDPIVENGPANRDDEVEVSPVWESEIGGPILVLVSESSHRVFHFKMHTISFVVDSDDG